MRGVRLAAAGRSAVRKAGFTARRGGPGTAAFACLWLVGEVSLSLAAWTLPGAARAANAITGGCTASSTGVVLPAYNLITKVQQTGTGTLAVQCTGTGTVTVQAALTIGTGTCTTRTMKNGANSLTYNIYTTAAYATVWCDPTTRLPTTFTFNSPTTPQTLTNNLTMYVKADSGQAVAIGNYSATVGSVIYWTGSNSATATFTVTESAPATCSASVTGLGFGTYAGTAITAQATVSVTCTSPTPYTAALGAGANVSGTQRRMKSAGGQFISYNLYSNAARTTAWGDGTGLGATVAGTGNGAAQPYIVYGRTVAGILPTPATYSDSVVVTITY
ncbi:MAG: lipoprotein [Alphaproteobacteria bacterium]|nr:lipoprotein [Alphaproteobacteria bacterium]